MATSVSRESGQGKRKLLDRVRDAIRFKHYSLRTEQAYVDWIKRFILFHGKRHPESMGAAEVRAFLTDLVANQNVAASTQNQARKSLLRSKLLRSRAKANKISDALRLRATLGK